jgi:hypothetical protein
MSRIDWIDVFAVIRVIRSYHTCNLYFSGGLRWDENGAFSIQSHWKYSGED